MGGYEEVYGEIEEKGSACEAMKFYRDCYA